MILTAHLDEVCLTVTGTDNGMLKFRAAFGSVDGRVLPGTVVRVLSEPPCCGVITCLPPHILTAEEQEKPFEMDMLRIDLGMTEEQASAIAWAPAWSTPRPLSGLARTSSAVRLWTTAAVLPFCCAHCGARNTVAF